jgi:hypothetical protein
MLPKHCVRLAFSFAEASAGNNSAARIAMMAMTTSSSIKVKAFPSARLCRRRREALRLVVQK